MGINLKQRNFKGTKDHLPASMILRNQVINLIKKSFEEFAFLPIETPAIEYLETLVGKYGKECEKLIYPLKYKEGKVAGLRYDLTVPLSRFINQHQEHISFPFRRYQIEKVWRADRPQIIKGRFREFYQCDVDIVGSKSTLAEAEIISLTYEILNKLNIGNFIIKINHRKILKGILEKLKIMEINEKWFFQSLDKLDKIGHEGVKSELKERGFENSKIEYIFEIINSNKNNNYIKSLKFLKKEFKNIKIAIDGISELEKIINYTKSLKIPTEILKIDLSLSRGLDYYTGSIYESYSLDQKEVGSLSGGGRYDNLIKLGKNNISAVGTTLGLERIIKIMEKLKSKEIKKTLSQILITRFEEIKIENNLEIAKILRDQNLITEIYYTNENISKQLSYANKKSIRYVIIIGKEEKQQNKITIKDLVCKKQESIPKDNLINFFKKRLK